MKRYNLLRYVGCALGTSLLASVMLTSCADDLDVREGVTGGFFDGNITLNFTVPEATVVETRAQSDQEKKLDGTLKHYAFLYQKGSGDTYTLAETPYELTISDNQTTAQIAVPGNVSLTDLKIIVVANLSATDASSLALAKGSSLETLLGKTTSLTSNSQPASPFIMSGEASEGSAGTYTIDLHRTAAKVSIELNASVKNFTLQGYTMHNAPNNGYIAAKVALDENKENYVYYATPTSSAYTYTAVKSDNVFQNYTYPVKSAGQAVDNPSGAYFIVEGEFEGEKCYYRVDLRDGVEYTNKYFDIQPNHWYQVEITQVLRKGYTSAAEAAKRYMGQEDNPAIDVKIHDHAANVLSMTTDGIRELGVTGKVDMTSDGGVFTVKVYSGAANKTTEEAADISVAIIEGSSWLQVGSRSEITVATEATSGNQTGKQTGDVNDGDKPGRRFTYPLSFKTSNIYNDESAIIRVTWQGLTRDIEVNYSADFKPEDACTATLYCYTIQDQSTLKKSIEYWPFLKTRVQGIDQDAMADGKIRNEGLHFAMPYGTNGSKDQWIYKYDMDFGKIDGTGDGKIANIEVTTSGSSYFADNLTWAYTKGEYRGILGLKNPQVDDFNYSTGTISFIITYGNGNQISLNMGIYHTGFFHFTTSTPYDSTSKPLYYEVVKLGDTYWLDRNLGATSNKMYVDNDATKAGSSDAAGNYYKVVDKGSNFGDPTAVYSNICPPGYRVPNSTDWDAVRLSPNFTTESVNDGANYYMATFYNTHNTRMGHIYFPKARFYNSDSELATGAQMKTLDELDGSLSGNSANGYYWTTSVSSGLEKKEIGQWLQALNLSGASHTYISGSIQKHLMSVRCIAVASHAKEEKYTISFNVKGATHVYLYSMDNSGNRSGIFSFPGKAVGSQSSVDKLYYNDDNSYLHFSYTSTQPAKDEEGEQKLFVFFAYQKDNGEITLLTVNGATTVAAAEGWPVEIGYNYFFDKEDNFKPMPRNDQFPWTSSGTPSVSTKFYQAGKSVTVKWYKRPYGWGTDFNRIHVWFPNGNKPLGDWGDARQVADSNDGTYYYKTFTVATGADSDSFSFILTAGDSGNQTNDLKVGKTNGTTTDNTEYSVSKDGSGNVTVTVGNYYRRN